ncbi:MAG TPA: EAL domain-containing protein, partial [Acidimicrobiia bacterium]
AKERGRARYQVFDDALHAHAVARLDLELELRDAFERGEMRVEYQPIVGLADDRIIGAEALLRWHHPTRGTLAPGEFIDVAEETGLIVPVGCWTVHEACAQLARWTEASADGHRPELLAVNVSGRQLADPDLVPTVDAALRDTGIDARRFCIEITETAIMHDPADAQHTLGALRGLGVKIALDDFGTGYSSLGYIRRFPVDIVKIDHSFVEGVAHDAESAAIVAAVTAMARALALTTVAEGVESAERLAQLQRLGVDWVQGYYFSVPIPGSELMRMPSRAGELVAG